MVVTESHIAFWLPESSSCCVATPRSLSSFVSLLHKCLSWLCAPPRGNRSKPLGIHRGLSDRCLPISITLLQSYCVVPGCFNASPRTALKRPCSAPFPDRLITDTDANAVSHPHRTVKICSTKIQNKLEQTVMTAIMIITPFLQQA